MDIKSLSGVLKRAERLFRLSGAENQATALRELDSLLPSDCSQSVDDFVRAAHIAIEQPELFELSPEELARRLDDLRADRGAFNRLLPQLDDRRLAKETLFTATAIYVGLGNIKPPWRSKAAAIKAISESFKKRAYLTEKADINDGSKPF